ncbi:MAG: CDP-archaeol synthase [Rikenellaceae bacterium]
MLKRAISGAILVAFMLLMILLSSQTYLLLWIILASLTLVEFFSLMAKHGAKFNGARVLVTILGAIYIFGSYSLLAFGFGDSQASGMLIVSVLTLIWSNDVGAYLFGMSFGRHKMAPRISPKKTWEGFFGGLISAVGVAILWQVFYWGDASASSLPLDYLFFGGLGLVSGLGAVLGDLLESAFKRRLQIKDSGRIIPGHGGMLDRFDALLMAAPLVWLYILIII